MGLLVEELAERVLDLILYKGRIGGVAIEANERLQHSLARTRQQLLSITHIDEATRNDVRSRQRAPSLLIDCQDSPQDAILSQDLAIAQHDLADIAYAQA